MANSKTRPAGATRARPAKPRGKPDARSATPMRHRLVPVIVAALVVAIVVAVLSYLVLRDGATSESPSAGATELEHVHGLSVDPADGTLYAGTHYGLFRLPEQGEATRVAGRVQDFMGFTVAGPGHFLASGHPGEGQEGPSSLGLIESADGGQTWQPLSLAGEADFHALEYRHGQVYGVNSLTGQFLVSDDKKTWDARSDLPMADFAVSPTDPDVILATTEQGLARSADGARSFGLVSGAPLLLLVSWAEDGTIVGVGPEGGVHVSSDEGATWQQRGTLDGPPEALAARSQDEIYAAAGGAVLVSTNGGRDFTIRYQD